LRAGKLAGWLGLIGALSALNYASRFTEGKPPRNALYQYGTAFSGLVFYAIILAVVLLVARGLPRSELGLRAPASWKRALGLALVVLIALLIAEVILESVLHGAREQGLEPPHWEPERAAPFAFNAAVIVLVAPPIEELAFRGLGFALLRPLSVVLAVVATALAFAAAHGLVSGFPALFLFGLAVAFLRARTRSLYPGMVLHACFNAAALAPVFVR
jgi:hypothetical protein